MITKMKLSHFSFDLPEELLAKRPSQNRDESRLLVVHRDTGKIEHRQFKDLIDYFDDQDVMILNNTKVFPARMFGNKEKTGARIEVFLLRELNQENRLWDVLVDPARKIRIVPGTPELPGIFEDAQQCFLPLFELYQFWPGFGTVSPASTIYS